VERFLVACRYLTALPLPAGPEAGDLGRAAGWFPVVGLVLGLLLAAAALPVFGAAPAVVASVLIVALWAFLTGGLHLDGLADTADGLGAGFGREEALAIMRDARIGAYGVTAIALVLAAKLAALASLAPDLRWRGLILAPVLGRLGPLLLARVCPPARGEGAGHAFAQAVSRPAVAAGALVATAAAVALTGVWAAALLGLVAGLAVAFGSYLRWRLGGLTGDCLGALVEASEAGSLVALSVLGHLGRL
jgi:adenosylcobinamide-GDP ribazoletransferase